MGTMFLLYVVAGVSGTGQTTVIATIGAAIIAGVVAVITARSSARAQVTGQTLVSRTDIEREAFDRAKIYYTDVIDRQHREHLEDRERIEDLEAVTERQGKRIESLDRQLAKERRERAAEEARLHAELDAAKTALALKFPDEP